MFGEIPLRHFYEVLLGVQIVSFVRVLQEEQPEAFGKVIHTKFVVLVPIVDAEQVFVLLLYIGANVKYCQHLNEHLEV